MESNKRFGCQQPSQFPAVVCQQWQGSPNNLFSITAGFFLTMANWWKMYETDLDESRLKYALGKVPEVGWVWVGILSECCKHRSDTLRWSSKEHELFGFSDRLKVSIPKVNESINLLCEIEYIEHTGEFLKVLRWNDKQSDYCSRKLRGDYGKKRSSRIKSDSIRFSPLEERRGEEKRREESVPRANGFSEIPTVEEVITYGSMGVGIPEDYCRHYHDRKTVTNGWIKNGQLINWKMDIGGSTWWGKDRATWFQKPNGKPTAYQLNSAITALKERLTNHRGRRDHANHEPNQIPDYRKLQVELETALKTLSEITK